MEVIHNKKILLRERKRHTYLGVSSPTRGGVPPLLGTPLARSNGGVPKVGYPPIGVPPIEVPPSKVQWGVPKVRYPLLGYTPS